MTTLKPPPCTSLATRFGSVRISDAEAERWLTWESMVKHGYDVARTKLKMAAFMAECERVAVYKREAK